MRSLRALHWFFVQRVAQAARRSAQVPVLIQSRSIHALRKHMLALACPRPTPRPTTLTHAHTSWQDPFSYFRDMNRATRAHIGRERRYFKLLKSQHESLYNAQLAKICAHPRARQSSEVTIRGYTYYTRVSERGALLECRRNDATGIETVILNRAGKDGNIGVGELKMSPNDQFAALAVQSEPTDDRFDTLIIDLSLNPPAIAKTLFGVARMEWANDSNTLLYIENNEHAHPAILKATTRKPSQNADVVIFTEADPKFFLDISKTKDDQFFTINSNSKTSSEVRILSANTPLGTPVVVHPRDSFSYFVEHWRDQFFIICNSSGVDYEIVAVAEGSPSKAHWRSVFRPAAGFKIEDAEFFAEYCVIFQRSSEGRPSAAVMSLADPSNIRLIPLPKVGQVCTLRPNPSPVFSASCVLLTTESPVQPPTDWRYDFKSGHIEQVSRSSGSTLEPDLYQCYGIHTHSADGVQVPITLAHHRDLKFDENNPVLVIAYGAYGVPLELDYRINHAELLAEGWVLAYCHVRGGGDCGNAWHSAARQHTKPNSFSDLRACVGELFTRRITKRGLVAARAASAGGLLVAAVCNQDPTLFSAVILRMPFVDMMGSLLDPSLPLTLHETDEWGDPINNHDDFRLIHSYCPYTNVSAQGYPPMLVTASLHDDRVQYWQPLKYVSKLRQLSTSESKIWLDIKTDSGHFTLTNEDIALENTFLLAHVHPKNGQ
eukprot:m.203473 g.203473  ORF g.203473 m.203473 type:complete len:717 (-) comp53852_c0_seq1:109-2259(-)